MFNENATLSLIVAIDMMHNVIEVGISATQLLDFEVLTICYFVAKWVHLLFVTPYKFKRLS